MKPGERIGCPLIWAGALLEAAEYLEGRINGGMTQQNVDGTHYHFYEPIQNLTISRS